MPSCHDAARTLELMRFCSLSGTPSVFSSSSKPLWIFYPKPGGLVPKLIKQVEQCQLHVQWWSWWRAGNILLCGADLGLVPYVFEDIFGRHFWFHFFHKFKHHMHLSCFVLRPVCQLVLRPVRRHVLGSSSGMSSSPASVTFVILTVPSIFSVLIQFSSFLVFVCPVSPSST